jgi:hypothetical protein
VGNGDGLPVSSHLFNGDLAQNQLEVKNFFKALGLTKLQTAAIMGIFIMKVVMTHLQNI